MLVDQFEELLGQSTLRLVMALDPGLFICAQPSRLRALSRALRHCLEYKNSEKV